MQHQSLTAEIASKGKKSMQNFEPTFFSEIPYANVNEINYLRDLEEKKKSIDFDIFEFEKDFGEQAPINEYDMLANTLYKKIMQHGYIQQKKAPSKKKKKTKNPFEYDYEDVWINDEEAITVKKNIYAKLENFQCLNQGVDQFYDSELYKSSLNQIQQQSKKRTNEISMDAQSLELIKKKIKENISITHNRMKEEIQADKPTCVVENINYTENSLKLQSESLNQNSPQIQPQSDQIKTQTDKSVSDQLPNEQLGDKKPESNSKTQIKDESDQNQTIKSKKKTKSVSKQKNIKLPGKKEKNSKQKSALMKNQKLQENFNQNKSQENKKELQSSSKSDQQEGQIKESDKQQSLVNGNTNIQQRDTFVVQKQHACTHQEDNDFEKEMMQNQDKE